MGADKLRDMIKQIIKEYVENENMSDLVYGTYLGGTLKIDTKPQAIPIDMVDIPLHLKTITATLSATITEGFEIIAKDKNDEPITVESITLTNVPVTLQTGLIAGQKVAVIQQRGSQRYSIIDRV